MATPATAAAPIPNTQAERGRRGRKSDVEWINRRRLLRGSDRLTGEQRATLFEKLTAADPNGDIAAALIAKDLLRDVLACKDNGGLGYEIRGCVAPLLHVLHGLLGAGDPRAATISQ